MKKYTLPALGLFGIMLALLVVYALPIWPAVATEVDLTIETRTDAEIMAHINEIEAKLATLQALFDAAASTSESVDVDAQSGLTISVNGEVLRKDSGIASRADAVAACEAVAYDTAFMWQLVTCDFGGERFYSDVFIAG